MSGAGRYTMESSVARAKSLGQKIVLPKPNELFLDIDSEADWCEFLKNSALIENDLIEKVETKVSKSGLPKRHVIVTLNRDVRVGERILLQAVLGSDRKHELWSFLAYKNGHPNPTMFFEKK